MIKFDCIILAGGYGTRLREVVNDRPKCLAPIDNEQTPFLKILINYIEKYNVENIHLSLGYMSEQVINFINKEKFDKKIYYIVENTPLGTGGAIKNALKYINNDNILIINADTFFNINLNNFFNYHLFNNSKITISVKFKKNIDRYGFLEIKKNKVIKFHEKNFYEKGYINAGYIFIDKTFFLKHNTKEIFSFENDFLTKFKIINKINIFKSKGYFIDIGIPKDYFIFLNYLNKRKKNG